jgi:hypothetical protein
MPGLFRTVTLRGEKAARLSWGYQTAAVLRTWALSKNDKNEWTLTAGIDRADPFRLQQAPLQFTAPRPGGFFCFPVKTVQLGRESLVASLGPPEH